MSASLVSSSTNSVTIEVVIPLTASMLETEEEIQTQLNAAGRLASAKALEKFDTNGQPIERSNTLWTSKGSQPKTYQTPYGKVSIRRYVYQTS